MAAGRPQMREIEGDAGLDRPAGVRLQPRARRSTRRLGRTNSFFLGSGRCSMRCTGPPGSSASSRLPDRSRRSRDRKRHVPVRHGGAQRSRRLRARRRLEHAGRRHRRLRGEHRMDEAILGRCRRNFLVRGTRNNMLKLLLDGQSAKSAIPPSAMRSRWTARAPKYNSGIITRLNYVSVVRRQQERRALLRRGRGRVAEAPCDLGPPRRPRASPTRSPTSSSIRRRSRCSCRRVTTIRALSIRELAAALGLEGRGAGRDGDEFQYPRCARHSARAR